MLPPASVLSANILALPTSADKAAAMMLFVNTICDYVDLVKGSGGSSPILAMDRMTMYNVFMTQSPTPTMDWTKTFSDAFYAGASSGTISSGTVTNPAWIGGSTVDTLTAPTGSATITNLSAARNLLDLELQLSTFGNNPAMPFAVAVRDATLLFKFNCIGEDSGGYPAPVIISAE